MWPRLISPCLLKEYQVQNRTPVLLASWFHAIRGLSLAHESEGALATSVPSDAVVSRTVNGGFHPAEQTNGPRDDVSIVDLSTCRQSRQGRRQPVQAVHVPSGGE